MCGVLDFTGYGDDLQALCESQTITVQDVYEHAMESQPTVAFAKINSKADSTQMAFYSSIATTEHKLPLTLTSAEFANDLKVILERYDAQPNYISYLVDGAQHCFTPSGIT